MICPACNMDVEVLQRHHWYEKGELKIKEICYVCNRVLGPAELWDSWGVQEEWLRACYRDCSRVATEKIILDRLHQRAEFNKTISRFLSEHSTFDLSAFLCAFRTIEDRYERKNTTWGSKRGYYKGTHIEELTRTQLLKHPRKNKIALCELDNSIEECYKKALEDLRTEFGLDESSPDTSALKLFEARRLRSHSTKKVLREAQKPIRAAIKALKESNPEEYKRLQVKAGLT